MYAKLRLQYEKCLSHTTNVKIKFDNIIRIYIFVIRER